MAAFNGQTRYISTISQKKWGTVSSLLRGGIEVPLKQVRTAYVVLACEQALCLGKKNEEREGKGLSHRLM